MSPAPTYDRSDLAATCIRVEADGMWLSVREAGAGSPMVMVHGYGVSHLEFRRVIEPLAARWRVIVPDLPGHGESDAPVSYPYTYAAVADTIARLLEAMGLRRVSLVGHSMGGGVALHVAARYGWLVDRLVLSDSACYRTNLPWEGRLVLLPWIGRFLFCHGYGAGDLLRYFRRRVYRDPGALDEALVRYYWSRMEPHKGAAYAMLRSVASAHGLAELPGQVRCPTLVVWGEHDRIFPVEQGRRLSREIEGARLEVLPDCGHAPAEERPGDFVDTVTRFLT